MKYNFFENKECEYYPCHKTDKINCLFCFCPLYFFDCHGDYIILENGKKDCSSCLVPHNKSGYDFVVSSLKVMIFGTWSIWYLTSFGN